jgi:hypothetical protein
MDANSKWQRYILASRGKYSFEKKHVIGFGIISLLTLELKIPNDHYH